MNIRTIILLLAMLLLSGCDKDHKGCGSNKPGGGKPVAVPDTTNTLVLFGVAAAAGLGWYGWRMRK